MNNQEKQSSSDLDRFEVLFKDFTFGSAPPILEEEYQACKWMFKRQEEHYQPLIEKLQEENEGVKSWCKIVSDSNDALQEHIVELASQLSKTEAELKEARRVIEAAEKFIMYPQPGSRFEQEMQFHEAFKSYRSLSAKGEEKKGGG